MLFAQFSYSGTASTTPFLIFQPLKLRKEGHVPPCVRKQPRERISTSPTPPSFITLTHGEDPKQRFSAFASMSPREKPSAFRSASRNSQHIVCVVG